jgi:hypothetical protein
MDPRYQFVRNNDAVFRGTAQSYFFAGRNLHNVTPEEDAQAGYRKVLRRHRFPSRFLMSLSAGLRPPQRFRLVIARFYHYCGGDAMGPADAVHFVMDEPATPLEATTLATMCRPN